MAAAGDDPGLDVSNLTVGDIQRLDNPVLKGVLLQVKKQLEEEAAGARDPMQHTSHSVFYQEFYNYTG
jgi:hypothetical protein